MLATENNTKNPNQVLARILVQTLSISYENPKNNPCKFLVIPVSYHELQEIQMNSYEFLVIPNQFIVS